MSLFSVWIKCDGIKKQKTSTFPISFPTFLHTANPTIIPFEIGCAAALLRKGKNHSFSERKTQNSKRIWKKSQRKMNDLQKMLDAQKRQQLVLWRRTNGSLTKFKAKKFKDKKMKGKGSKMQFATLNSERRRNRGIWRIHKIIQK